MLSGRINMKINNKKQNSEPVWGFPSQEKSLPGTREGFR